MKKIIFLFILGTYFFVHSMYEPLGAWLVSTNRGLRLISREGVRYWGHILLGTIRQRFIITKEAAWMGESVLMPFEMRHKNGCDLFGCRDSFYIQGGKFVIPKSENVDERLKPYFSLDDSCQLPVEILGSMDVDGLPSGLESEVDERLFKRFERINQLYIDWLNQKASKLSPE